MRAPSPDLNACSTHVHRKKFRACVLKNIHMMATMLEMQWKTMQNKGSFSKGEA
jgi:hypothetical protein